MSIKTDFITAVERDGFYLMENVLDSDFLKRAKDELESAINKETEYHHDALHRDYGMVLLCCLYGGVFFEIFEIP